MYLPYRSAGFLFALMLFLLPFAPAQAADDGWRLAREGKGVQVWKRILPGQSLAEFRGEVTVKSSLSALMELFYDLDNVPRWLDHTRRVSAVRRDDPKREYTLRIETDMPWPVKDRDAVVAGRWWQDPRSLAIYMRGKSVDDALPVDPAYVRAIVRTDWTFIPQPDGRVRVIMEGSSAPEGDLPIWAVNLLIQESPYRTLTNMVRIISESRYQGARFEGVTEMAKTEPLVRR